MKNNYLKFFFGFYLSFTFFACGTNEDVPRCYEYIRGQSFTNLAIELDTVSSFAPSVSIRAHLESSLNAVLEKSEGVLVAADNFLDSVGSNFVWTEASLLALAENNYDLEVPANTIKMHTLFVDGSYVGDTNSSKTLVLKLNEFQMVVFIESIDEACNGGINKALPQADRKSLCTLSTAGVWLHGAGQLLGLVNDGLPMVGDHEDLTHKGYSANENSVMHRTFGRLTLIERYRDRVLAGNLDVISFDAACIADINAVKTGD
jgi:hypothetical protein